MHDQTMSYLTENNTLHRYQSGLRKNYLPDSFFSYLADKILAEFNSGLLIGMILIDLQEIKSDEILLKKCLFLYF